MTDTITVTPQVSVSENDVAEHMAWTFDFEGTTPGQVRMIAMKQLVIMGATVYRNKKLSSEKRRAMVTKTWSVKDMCEHSRTKADPVKKAGKLVETMSQEQKDTLLRILQA